MSSFSVLSAYELLPAVPSVHLFLDLLSSWSFLFGSNMSLFPKVNFCSSSSRFLYSHGCSAPRTMLKAEVDGFEDLFVCSY